MIDWNVIATEVLKAVLPILATALTVWVLVKVKEVWSNLQAQKPDVAGYIMSIAGFAVAIAEQLKQSGKLPNNEAAKAYACNYIESVLKAKGIVVDIDPWLDIIADAVEGAVYQENKYNDLPWPELVEKPQE